MGFSRQEYWSGLPFPPPGDPPNLGIKPGSPTLQADTLPSEPPGKPNYLSIQSVPCGSTGKESACSAGDLGSNPGLGQMPWRRERLQYSGLENSMDSVVHGFSKSQAWLSSFHFHFSQCSIANKMKQFLLHRGYSLVRETDSI